MARDVTNTSSLRAAANEVSVGEPVSSQQRNKQKTPKESVNPNERLWDMCMDPRAAQAAGKPHFSLWFAHLVEVVVGAICRVLFRYTVDGIETIRAFEGKRGAIVISNHVSFFDIVFIWLSMRPHQWIRPIARDDLFSKGGGLLGWAISRVGAFPIKRDSADLSAVKRAVRMCKQGELVGIMPEGTRRNKGSKTPEIHAGVSLIAKMAKAPIIPMTVRDVEKIKQKGQRVRFPQVSLQVGSPILLQDFDFLPKEDRMEACAWYAMREVFAMNQRIPAQQVDMQALFPGSRDYSEVFAQHEMPVHTAEEVCEGYCVWAQK